MEEDILSAGCRFHADIVAEIALVNNTLEWNCSYFVHVNLWERCPEGPFAVCVGVFICGFFFPGYKSAVKNK